MRPSSAPGAGGRTGALNYINTFRQFRDTNVRYRGATPRPTARTRTSEDAPDEPRETPSDRLHPGRAAGGHHDHRHPRGTARPHHLGRRAAGQGGPGRGRHEHHGRRPDELQDQVRRLPAEPDRPGRDRGLQHRHAADVAPGLLRHPGRQRRHRLDVLRPGLSEHRQRHLRPARQRHQLHDAGPAIDPEAPPVLPEDRADDRRHQPRPRQHPRRLLRLQRQ